MEKSLFQGAHCLSLSLCLTLPSLAGFLSLLRSAVGGDGDGDGDWGSGSGGGGWGNNDGGDYWADLINNECQLQAEDRFEWQRAHKEARTRIEKK